MLHSNNSAATSQPRLAALSVAAMGVVYGDIGTSPLYTMKEVFNGPHAVAVTENNLLGILSLIFWALTITVSLKYVLFITRADNRGEGGIMALTALALRTRGAGPGLMWLMSVLGIFGAGLFHGDAVITPAMSVLSAVEGLEIATPMFKPYVVPITIGILCAVFIFQPRGTASVGALFGPVMMFWFGTLGVLGVWNILRHPEIIAAINPWYAAHFFLENRGHAYLALGAVVLAITGGEALYADMGHFGAKAIRAAWSLVVLPCLALNYLGQGALLLAHPEFADSPFYRLFPAAMIVPVVLLATAAAIIASQAVITGAFSITQQVIQLGFLPRMRVVHTSHQQRGQIYMPVVNWLLMAGVVAAAIGFGSSSALAGAYGLAVTLGMFIDTLLLACVALYHWRVPKPLAVAGLLLFGTIDVLLIAACATKLVDGGWLALGIAALVMLLVSTWRTGRRLSAAQGGGDGIALDVFLHSLMLEPCRARRARPCS